MYRPLNVSTPCNERSNASKQHRLFTGASSQTIKDVISRTCERFVFFYISHDEVSKMVSGILKRDCTVRSPSNNNDVIPDEATAMTIKSLDRILLIAVCHKKVFLVPPCQWTNTKACLLSMTTATTYS